MHDVKAPKIRDVAGGPPREPLDQIGGLESGRGVRRVGFEQGGRGYEVVFVGVVVGGGDGGGGVVGEEGGEEGVDFGVDGAICLYVSLGELPGSLL